MARVIIVSNRVPLPSKAAKAGGLTVALKEVFQHGALWLGWSGEIAAETATSAKILNTGKLEFATIDLSEEDYRRFYVGFANSVLWPLLHFQPGLLEFAREDFKGYLAVNRTYAKVLAELLRPDDLIWVHDYHLIPLGEALRTLGVKNRIGFFLHVPFVPASVFSVLPPAEQLLRMMLAYDVVGFQARQHLHDFEDCLLSFLNIAHLPGEPIWFEERPVTVDAIPIGIDSRGFARQAKTAVRRRATQRLLESIVGHAFMIGIDRLDYSKGLPNRFEAFGHLLDRFPEHRMHVTYLQVAARSREDVVEYQRLKHELDRLSGEINGRYADFDWQPLRYMTRAVSRANLAGFHRQARVGLVTPLRDGMNLVAKEYIAAQDPEDPGVLILSRFAGAAEELTEAIIVNPYDPEEITEAMHAALTMPLDERQNRHEKLFGKICQTTAATYCRDFLTTLAGEASSAGAFTSQ
jgi:trehalose 6-phosphate synthase